MNERIERLRERWGDQLLTILTITFLIVMFVLAPLQAVGAFIFQAFDLIVVLLLVGGVFIMSGSRIALVVMLVAVSMASVAAIHRLKVHSISDVYLMAGAWLILGITLSWVVSRAVFAPGRVTYHRLIGSVLLYLAIGFIFVALYLFVGLFTSNAYSGLALVDSPALASSLIYFSFVTLTTLGYGDIVPLHPLARSLSNLESIIGLLYPATLLARFVTLELGAPD
jgi:hypothetical protein